MTDISEMNCHASILIFVGSPQRDFLGEEVVVTVLNRKILPPGWFLNFAQI